MNIETSFLHDEYRVSNSARILSAVKGLVNKRGIVHAYLLPDRKHSFRTALLEIDPKHRYVLLDALMPDEGFKRLDKGMNILVSGRSRGVYTGFSSQVLAKGMDSFQLNFPEVVYQLQRREHFRVRPDGTVQVALRRTNGSFAKGAMLDISTGGVGVMFNRSVVPTWVLGEELSEVRFDLPDHGVILSRGTVRTVMRSRSQSGSKVERIGVEFVDIGGAEMANIQRYVLRRDRESLSRTRA